MKRLRFKRTMARVAMTLLMMLLIATTAWADNVAVTSVSDFGTMTEGTTTKSGYYTLTSGNTYTLQNDVTIDSYLSIPEGTIVTIDLNGHTLNRGLNQSSAIEHGHVIKVRGGLTLNDSRGGGTVTGGCTNTIGAGVIVSGAGATFTMNGGCITGNQQKSDIKQPGGGVSVRSNATFVMNGGSITNNETTTNGGGVFVETATFTMNGGTISGNRCSSDFDGAGVYVYHSALGDNHATINVSGSAIVTGNTKGTSTTDNVYLCDNTIINVTSALTTSANIGVRMADRNDYFAQGSGYSLTASDANHFSSDVSGYYIAKNSETGKLYLSDKDPALLSVLNWNADGHYFEIADEQDLIDLAEYVRGGSDRYCAGLTFKMTANLDFTNKPDNCHDKYNNGSGNFLPIGLDGTAFAGHFDGDGHTITGLSFSYPNNDIGLFKTLTDANAMVEGVTLVNPIFSAHNDVGGIVGFLRAGTVSNCAVVGGTISGTGEKVGGIVGVSGYSNASDVKTISGCTVVGTTLSGPEYVGIIVGCNTNSSAATAALTISGCKYHNPDGLAVCGYGSGNRYTDGGGNQQVYQARLADGLTASSAIYSYGNDYYFAEDATVTLGHDRPGYVFKGYESNDVTITNGTFTMPDKDVSVSAAWYDLALFGYNDDPLVDGSADHPYTIGTIEGWNLLSDALQDNTTWNRFSGKTVKLGADIGTAQNPISRMACGSYEDFTGTFDGDGHTLYVSYGTDSKPIAEDNVAPFRNVENGCVIKNLHVAGDIYSSKKYAAGIAGTQYGTVSITNCRSSVTIHSYTSGDGTHSGIVGRNGGNLTIEGCVFDGKLLTCGVTTTTDCAGFVGWKSNNNTVSISNSLYAPAALADGETEISEDCATFVRNGSAGNNSYYTRLLGTAQGKAARRITAGEDVTIVHAGDATTYDVSGITAYKDGETQKPGLLYNGTLYAGNEDAVSLTLQNSAAVPQGYQYDGYVTSGGTLTGSDTDGWTLTMPDEDVTISPDFEIIQFEQNGLTYKWNDAVPNSVMVIYSELGDDVSIAIPNTVEHNGVTYNVTAIGDDAFVEKASLTSIIFPTKLVSIGSRAFKDCTGLSVTIPAGVTLGSEAFNRVCSVTALLADNADNSALINSYHDAVMNVSETYITLQGRTLYKDGDWNTLCLPFNVKLADSPLEDATLMELDTEGTYDNGKQTGLDGTTLNLYFKNTTSISAGKPYIIRWEGTYIGDPIVNPTFPGVTIDNVEPEPVSFTGGSFKGTYDPIVWSEENKSILLLGDNNTLFWPQPEGDNKPYLNAFRAYFELNDGASVREFKLNFDGGESTSIHNAQCTMHNEAGAWYDMQGRKVSKPTKKGMYIHNGSKVVVK